MSGRSSLPKNMIRKGEKWKKWRREEEEGSCSNFNHDEADALNNNILTIGKAAVEDITKGKKERREMEEIEEGRRRKVEGGGGGGGGRGEGSGFWIIDKVVVLNRDF